MCVPAQLITTRGVNVSQAPSAPRDPPPPSLVLQECTVMILSWPSLKVQNSKGPSLPSCGSNQFNVLLKWYIVQELYFYSSSIQLCVHHVFFFKNIGFPLGNCQAGYYCPIGQTEANPATFLCIAGHYCEEGSGTPTQCPIGTFSNATGNSNVTDCKPCTAGEKATNNCFNLFFLQNLLNMYRDCHHMP